ncbi:hypothetical protein, partial [Streptomyces sp. McG7]|uniref:hypothetical protein n=1 Tax=Streptomyces sp. McG7 TaxID=2725486 RepID=UPI001BE717D0|nr:hypothetical protein [Streptomyces sp. McG7]
VSAGVLVIVLIAGSSSPDRSTADPTAATGAGGRAAAGTGTERAIRTRTDAIFGTQEPRTAAAPSTKVTS